MSITKIDEQSQAIKDFMDVSLCPMYRFACALKANRIANELNARTPDDAKSKITDGDLALMRELGVSV